MTSEYIRYIFRYIFCYIMCIHIFRESSHHGVFPNQLHFRSHHEVDPLYAAKLGELPLDVSLPRLVMAELKHRWRDMVFILPSGKRLHNYGKSPFLMGKSTIYKWPFSIATLNYQRVSWNWVLTNNSSVSHRSCDFWTPQCNNVKTKTRGTSRERMLWEYVRRLGYHWNQAQYVLSNKMQWKIVKAPR